MSNSHISRAWRAGNTKVIVIVVLCVLGVFGLMCTGVGFFLIYPAMQQAQTAAQRAASNNNLKQIGLALHNYHDAYNMFPPRIYDGETPYNNWQTGLLPYIEQGPTWDALDQNAPWTAPANNGVYRMPIPQYLNPSIAEQFDANGLAVSHYAGNSQVFRSDRPTKLADIKDGTTNTIMVGEVAAGFLPWGDPENVRDPAAGIHFDAQTFGNAAGDGAQFVMGDGAVRFISADASPAVMKALATPAGQDTVPPGEF